MRVLVCGSRTFEDEGAIHALLDGLWVRYGNDLVVIEGAAPGADSIAGAWADEVWEGVDHLRFPANWDQHGKAAGPIRNTVMLVEGKPDIVYAFIDKPLEKSRGTAHMVFIARDAGVPVVIVRVDP